MWHIRDGRPGRGDDFLEAQTIEPLPRRIWDLRRGGARRVSFPCCNSVRSRRRPPSSASRRRRPSPPCAPTRPARSEVRRQQVGGKDSAATAGVAATTHPHRRELRHAGVRVLKPHVPHQRGVPPAKHQPTYRAFGVEPGPVRRASARDACWW